MESSTQIEMLAAAWIAKRDQGMSAEDEAELSRWLQASTAHRVAFIRLDAAWRAADRLQVLGAGATAGVVPAPGEWRQSPFFSGSGAAADHTVSVEPIAPTHVSRRRGVLTLFKALAACLLLAIVTTSHRGGSLEAASYRTETGASSTVPITDGSNITLDTNSEMHVTLSDVERRVQLEHGEAFFEVAKDPGRPFVVNAGALRVTAVGTEFSVRRENDQLRVVVTEGRVRVTKSEHGSQMPIAELAAGTIAHTQGEGILIQQQPLSRLEELLSWRTGFVVFHDTPLADAVAELNRYNARKITINDPAVAAIRISGNFRTTNGEAFVRLIEAGFPIRAQIGANQIVLMAE